MRPPGYNIDLNVVLSDSASHQLAWWQRLLHHWDMICGQYLPRHVLVRPAISPAEVAACLGEVWTLCGVCGRVFAKRRELPMDAARFGGAKTREGRW